MVWPKTYDVACSFFRWFCHVDDDNYVNVKTLIKLLSRYSHTNDIYIGKPSLDRPIQATERISESKMVSRKSLPRCSLKQGRTKLPFCSRFHLVCVVF